MKHARAQSSALLVVVSLAAGAAWWWRGPESPDEPASVAGAAGATAATATPDTWIGARMLPAGLAGSDACRKCHPAAYDAWGGSAHFANMQRPTPETVVGDFERNNTHEIAGTGSEMFRRDDGWFMRYTDADGATETLRIDYALGVARHQVYLHIQPDGRLQSLPTYWSIEESRWLDSTQGPVHDRAAPLARTDPNHWRNHRRTFNLSCLECHSSHSRAGYDPSTNRYESQFDMAISCESCHGPGAAHSTAWASLEGKVRIEGDGEMARLGHYDLEKSIEVCAACHALKRVYALGFAPGASFYDHFMPDVWKAGAYYVDGRSSTLNYRFVDYMQNGCMSKASQRMDCGFCHPPHDLESARDKTLVEANELCTQCHLQYKVSLTAHTHHGPTSEGSRCVECHMPKMDLKLRMTVRDHTIGSPLPDLTLRYGAPNACGVCHAEEGPAWAADHVTAWFGKSPHYQAYRARILERAEVLDQVFAQRLPKPTPTLIRWLEDRGAPLIQRASAAALLAGSAIPEAIDALIRALDDPHPMVRFYAVEAMGAMPGPKTHAALRRAVTDARRSVRVLAYRMLLNMERGLPDDPDPAVARARSEYRHRFDVLRADDPRLRADRAMVEFTYGRIDEAERLLRSLVRLAPRSPRHKSELAGFLAATRRFDEAHRVADELEGLEPDGVDVHATRAMILLESGRPRAALAAIEQVPAAARDEPSVVQIRQAALRARDRAGPPTP